MNRWLESSSGAIPCNRHHVSNSAQFLVTHPIRDWTVP